MSEVSEAIDEARAEIAAVAAEFMAGTCSLIPQVKADDGFSGHKMIDGTPVTGIPCDMEVVAGGFQVNDGDTVVTRTHRLKLPVTAQTVAITRKHVIAVDAQGLTSAVRLIHPIPQLGHKDVFLRVAANAAEGYGQPAMT